MGHRRSSGNISRIHDSSINWVIRLQREWTTKVTNYRRNPVHHYLISLPRLSTTIFTIKCYLPDTYAKRKTIDKRANLIELSSINNTIYLNPPTILRENVAEVTRRRLYLHYIHHYPLSSIIESLSIKTCQLSYKFNCIFLQEILFTSQK